MLRDSKGNEEALKARRVGATLSNTEGAALRKTTLDSATLNKSSTTLSNTEGAALCKTTWNRATLNKFSGAAVSKAAVDTTGRLSNRPGVGPPMQVKYKGELRSLHDGAGLCSPGRWPVGRRTAPATELGRELARWCLKAFGDWVELEGEERAKALFWSTAGGKHGGTPFGGEIYGFRERLDLWLKERGLNPYRQKDDRATEINFRRLRAVATALSDEDVEFLDEVAATGVMLGVDEEMPRNPAVYEEKTKWTVEQTEEDFQDMFADNYVSAEENAADIARQVLEEVENGTILRLPESEAKRRFAGRLAVAALGAVPKELGTSRVRLIHDGTYTAWMSISAFECAIG